VVKETRLDFHALLLRGWLVGLANPKNRKYGKKNAAMQAADRQSLIGHAIGRANAPGGPIFRRS